MSFYRPHCNACKNLLNNTSRWQISTTCGHILCAGCAGPNHFKCNQCGKAGKIITKEKVPPKMREYFHNPMELIKKAEKIYTYQAVQMNSYIKHLEEETIKLRRCLSASRKQTKFLRGMVPQEKIIEASKKIKKDIKQERVDEGFIDLASSCRSGRSQESFDPSLLSGVNWDEPMDENMDSSERSYNYSQAQRRSHERPPVMTGSSDPHTMRNEWRSRIYSDPTRMLSTQPALPSTQLPGRSWYSSMNRF
ncbi:nenya [Brevipalpus obovatus]|uniref:nenya n=1 Tax=Brevipalpus obovatus TaxID=246614 RepID=UPI003D9E1836